MKNYAVPLKTQLSKRIRRARSIMGINKRFAARALDITERRLTKYEKGLVDKIPLEILNEMADLYNSPDLAVDPTLESRIDEAQETGEVGKVRIFLDDGQTMPLGDWLHDQRVRLKKISRLVAAKRCKFSVQKYSAYENGYLDPSDEDMTTLLRVFS